MPLLIPEGFAQITWLFGGLSAPNGAACTQGVEVGGSQTLPDIADAAKDAWVAGLAHVQDANCVLTGVRVKAGPNATGPQIEMGYSLGGTASGSGVVPNAALLVRKLTNMGGRQGRGRMYVPGFTEQDVSSSGTIGGAYLANVQGHADTTFDDLVAALLIPVLFHDAAAPVTTPTTLVQYTVDATMATQRRRLRS